MAAEQQIKAKAAELGFTGVGIAQLHDLAIQPQLHQPAGGLILVALRLISGKDVPVGQFGKGVGRGITFDTSN